MLLLDGVVCDKEVRVSVGGDGISLPPRARDTERGHATVRYAGRMTLGMQVEVWSVPNVRCLRSPV